MSTKTKHCKHLATSTARKDYCAKLRPARASRTASINICISSICGELAVNSASSGKTFGAHNCKSSPSLLAQCATNTVASVARCVAQRRRRQAQQHRRRGSCATSTAAPLPQRSPAAALADVEVEELYLSRRSLRALGSSANSSVTKSMWPPGKVGAIRSQFAIDAVSSSSMRHHEWTWSRNDVSRECLVSDDGKEALFHPIGSLGAAAVRGSEPLKRNGCVYYWQAQVAKVSGTSVMFGVCTKDQKLHREGYCNIVGLDANGWSLSHKGLIWHNGSFARFSDAFPMFDTTVGMLLDTTRGELSYFLNGQYLGVAFDNLNDTDCDLYPVVGSTFKTTHIKLVCTHKSFMTLSERSRFVIIAQNDYNKLNVLKQITNQQLPSTLVDYLADACKNSEEEDEEEQQQQTQISNQLKYLTQTKNSETYSNIVHVCYDLNKQKTS